MTAPQQPYAYIKVDAEVDECLHCGEAISRAAYCDRSGHVLFYGRWAHATGIARCLAPSSAKPKRLTPELDEALKRFASTPVDLATQELPHS